MGCLVLVSILVWACWLVWLDRFVVYSADGARLDFSRTIDTDGEEALPPEAGTVAIHYNEGEDAVNTSTELTQITGYYVTTRMLLDGVDAVDAAIKALPSGSAVMLDLKSIYGNFYYSTDVPGSSVADQIDPETVDALIENLAKSDTYLIARIPAFRDRAYGLENTAYGLAVEEGYLWSGEDNCYWLDPTSNGTMFYLTAIITELRELGFDEVVLTDFCFPPTDEIVFSGDREQAIQAAAEALVSACSTSRFAVSFVTDSPGFSLPQGRSRMYLTGVDAGAAQSIFDGNALPLKEAQLVFLTETNDTRFNITSVVRPLPVTGAGTAEPEE